MISIVTPTEALEKISLKARERRVSLGFTQEGLAARADVSVATLRKFERTGQIALQSFLKLALVLESLEQLTTVFDAEPKTFSSLSEVLKTDKPKRKKGWRT